MTPTNLFAVQIAIDTGPSSLTSGPASGKRWIITSVFICNKAAVEAKVTVTHTVAATAYSLLESSPIPSGETVTIGPLVLINGESMEGTTVDGAVDFMAYGYEEDV